MRTLVIKHALILAAGRGKRLMPYTADRPKCLVKVGGKPILFYQLRALEMNGINDIVIAAGYKGEKIKDYVKRFFPRFSVKFVKNPRYLETNDIYSLYLARRYLVDNLILLDSDVLFHPDVIFKIVSYGKSAVGIRRGLCGEEEMKVELAAENIVARLSKSLEPECAAGEFMGISFFSGEFLKYLRPSLEEVVNGDGAYLDREVAIEKVISKYSQPLYALDVSRYPAIEIDFPADLKMAEEKILPKIIGEFNMRL